MVDVAACNIQTFGSPEMVHIRLYAKGIISPFKIKILSDELVFLLIFPHNLCLPGQKFCHKAALEFLKLTAQAAVDSPPHIREILPGMKGIAPVIHSELPVHGLHIALEFFL